MILSETFLLSVGKASFLPGLKNYSSDYVLHLILKALVLSHFVTDVYFVNDGAFRNKIIQFCNKTPTPFRKRFLLYFVIRYFVLIFYNKFTL